MTLGYNQKRPAVRRRLFIGNFNRLCEQKEETGKGPVKPQNKISWIQLASATKLK
jgi:hypothetical protein